MGLRPWLLLLLLALPAFGQAPTRVVSTLGSLGLIFPGTTQPHVQVLGQDNPGDWGPARTFRWDSTNALPTNVWRRATRNGVGRWIYDGYGETGTWSVANVSERDAIPFNRRTEGMLVYVQSTPPTMYRLDAGRNSWTEIPLTTVSEQTSIASTANREDLAKRLSSEAVPITVRQSTDKVLSGFIRNSQAFDPIAGTHLSSNVMRTFPISFGSQLAEAILIERQSTNMLYVVPPEGQLTAVRYTVSTNLTAGPFGMAIPAITYTDTDVTNTHYAYFGTGPADAPNHYGLLFKPNNQTNILYQMQVSVATNSTLSLTMTATLDGRELLPPVTVVTNSASGTFHDGGYVRLENGWYYGWMNVTLLNTSLAYCYVSPANFLVTVGRTGAPALYTAGYNQYPLTDELDTPVYPQNKTNSTLIRSKPQDTYAYTLKSSIKTSDGSLIFWLKNGAKQPTDAVLLENTGLTVSMTRSQLGVAASDQASGVSITATVPQLTSFGTRLVTLTWTTNGMRAFVDGALVGTSATPTGAFIWDSSGVIGRAAGDTNFWNGHIAAAYLGTALTDDEVALLPGLVGPNEELSTFGSLASRTGTEGADAPLPLNEVVYSPRFMGAGNYPYNATNKAKEFHATASLWVYFATNDTRIAGLRAVTPTVGGAIVSDRPTQNTNALMVDFVTGQNMKPSWYAFPGQWYACVNRPLYKQAVTDYINAYYALGITLIQHDDPTANHDLALPFLSYRYGSGSSSLGTLSSPTRGCYCSDCQAAAIVDGYSPLTTTTLRPFHSQTQTNYWQWVGGVVRSNVGMRISANLGPISLVFAQGYLPGRFHFPMIENSLSDTYPDKLIQNWTSFKGLPTVATLAVNTLAAYEDNFGAADRTRRWMVGSYAMGSLPILPWDVYNGDPVVRTFAGRASIVDISGFVRAKGEHLLRGYSLSSASGTTLSLPVAGTVAAWASTNQVLVVVRYRAEDGRRVIHCVDFRDAPASFTLNWWGPVVGSRSATVYSPAAYDVAAQDAAVTTGNFVSLATSSELAVSITNSVASVTMPAKLWQIVEVLE